MEAFSLHQNSNDMLIFEMLTREMEQEALTTRKMLNRVPDDKYDWKPHAKSMSIERLVNHIAELPSWVGITLHTSELDFAKNPYVPTTYRKTTDVIDFFERTLADALNELAEADESELEKPWTMRQGDYIISTSSKLEVLRMVFCQIVHHRAQLGVYLRLLDIPIPGSYGPSADEQQGL